jgi:hypothetical protein
VRRSLLSAAIVGLSLASTPGFSQLTVTTPVVEHDLLRVSQVYPVRSQGYSEIGSNPDGISPNNCFEGRAQRGPNVEVTPGIFCLATDSNFRLDVNGFVTCPVGYALEVVQSVRLTKTIPGSRKVPDCYRPMQFIQFGSGIRTWWALKYTQPGTTFCLELTVVCHRVDSMGRRVLRSFPKIHIDKWTWEVGVELATLPLVIDMLHSHPLSVLEFPCIADERVYMELRSMAEAFRDAPTMGEAAMIAIGIESFVAMQCVMVDFFVAPDFIRGPEFGFAEPPGNLPSGTNWTPFDGTADGGILDTLENPCCCKLIADVEYLFNKFNLGNW